jgi:hypothetical protein
VAEQTGFSYRVGALDLSNDGGALAVELARLARTVTVVIDDDRSFAAAAQTVQQHHARVQLRVSNLRELAAEGARYWLVTIGGPLRASDGAQLLAELDPLVERGGSLAVLGFRYPKLAENAWRYELELPLSPPVPDHDEGMLLASPFEHVERVSVFERRTLTVEQALAQYPELAHESLQAQLRAHASSDGTLHELVEGHALIARRPGDRSGRWS